MITPTNTVINGLYLYLYHSCPGIDYVLFLVATFISLASVILCELVGLEKLTNGFGLLCLVRGITAIAGPPLVG